MMLTLGVNGIVSTASAALSGDELGGIRWRMD